MIEGRKVLGEVQLQKSVNKEGKLIGTLKKSESIELDNDTEEEVPLTVEMKVENSESTENEAEDPLN